MSSRRAAAVVVAIVMIVGSIAIRALVIDDDSPGASRSGSALRLTCVTELAEACQAIARGADGRVRLTVEPAGVTARRFTLGPVDREVDGWLTLKPWPAIVAERRARANLEPALGTTSRRLARSPIVIALRRDRLAVLTRACRGDVDWTCIGNQAGRAWSQLGGDVTWGTVKPAHEEPVESASGLLVLGQAVGDYLAAPGIPVERVSSNDWAVSETFPGWFERLERSVPPDARAEGADPLAQWLRSRLTIYSLVAGIEADIGRALSASAVRNDATVLYPAPVASADVVFAPVGEAGDELAKIVSDRAAAAAYAREGWRVDGRRPAAGVGRNPLPESSGLPPAGTLDALQTLWAGVVR